MSSEGLFGIVLHGANILSVLCNFGYAMVQSSLAHYLEGRALRIPDGTMKLYQFIIMFGSVTLILAQMPSFHSLRHINLVSLILCLAYSACVTAGCIYIGHTNNAPVKDYSVKGSTKDRYFGIFNGISIIATTYASGIIPEIVKYVGYVCASVIVTTYFSVVMSGYWAFGNQAMGTVLSNFMGVDRKPLLPTWVLLMTNVFTLVQVLAVTVVYLQPTTEVFEKKFAGPKMDQFSIRNVVSLLILRSVTIVVATFFVAMLPFF
ncbi:putative amino acid transporter, transmembrane domain-containing protein [Rosa chinensis]|uniref:Putative amino acid transporter, transmembrane domain-containing protein n=1 Tax=Rosa chinensis TaxID=74649 RepID=A0A2P6SCC4_ROSCH|nr:putative amino acid transporter, transmembrane domain-containing protein [Rosa chinensis]